MTLKKLIDLSGPPLSDAPPRRKLQSLGKREKELYELLRIKNGFYAFESALHVFPSGPAKNAAITLEKWNDASTWKSCFEGLGDGPFFAEDIFGGQFFIRGELILTLDPETGGVESFAPNLEEWASRVLDDFEAVTGHPLAHKWQKKYGSLPAGSRLIPKKPFVLGGEYAIENLYASEAAKGMRLRSEIARQIRDLPDGAKVSLKVVE
jgi:hypothetical protein